VLAAVDVGLLDVDHDPALRPRSRHGVDAPTAVGGPERLVGDDPRRAVDVQADQVVHEVDHQEPDVAVLRDVAEARVHPVAAVLGIGERPLVDDLQEPGGTGPQGRVALAVRVGGRHEHHLHPRHELDHGRE